MEIVFKILGWSFTFGVPLVVVVAILGLRKNEGVWGNTIAAINVSFAALIALNYWEDVASLLAGMYAAGLFYWDFIAIWLLFLVAYALLDEVTRHLTRVKVKFPDPIELLGTPAAGLCLFAVFFLFYTFTLHLAPLGNPSEQGGIASYDLMKAKSYDILSSGNLAPFNSTNTFDSNKVFVNQNSRRAALKHVAESKGTTSFEGTVPKRN
ncbi:MAG TPA: hypothetical protein DEB39_10085 [Planctomycetaceae bacterium]|nr:hypothetical protein [Planctomycetaceae bacterium]